jgi:hypothetical protein
MISSAERKDDFVIVDKMLGMYCGEASSNIADKKGATVACPAQPKDTTASFERVSILTLLSQISPCWPEQRGRYLKFAAL